MAHYQVNSFVELVQLMEKHAKEREERVRQAIVLTLHQALVFVSSKTIPVAFGELAKSLHVVPGHNVSSLIADAPYAAAVENGARPHMPPLAPILQWVALRGLQGMNTKYNLRSSRELRGLQGSTTAFHSGSIARELKHVSIARRERALRYVRHNFARNSGMIGKVRANYKGKDPVSGAYKEVAMRIAVAISKVGTKPHKYMFACLPYVMKRLHTNIRKALQDP